MRLVSLRLKIRMNELLNYPYALNVLCGRACRVTLKITYYTVRLNDATDFNVNLWIFLGNIIEGLL